MAAASKGLGYARGEKVMKEIRGGLPEKDANKGFLGVSIGLLIIIVFVVGCYVEREQEFVKPLFVWEQFI